MNNDPDHFRYRCIYCSVQWGVEACEDISDGVCPVCTRSKLKHKIHNWQRREGSWDCFSSAIDYCSEECMFKWACLEKNLKEWEKYVIKPKGSSLI